MYDTPNLLVEWSSPWEEFRSAIRPALSRSPKPLAGEARTQLFPVQGMLLSWVCEALLLVAIIVIPAKLASMRPYAPPAMPKYDVIYFSGDELPRTEDVGGAETGTAGKAGGHEARHRTQTIRVARGTSVRDTVVDAPKLKLPPSNSAVANLLAFAGKLIPGPAPTEGMKSQSRAAPALDAAVPPTPQISRENVNPAPALLAQVVPPPATTRRDIASLRVPGSQPVAVVPPPVSAPERVTIANPKLTLPAALVVAPPPQVTREVAVAGPGFGPGDLHKQVVPPPAQVSGVTGNRSISGVGDPAVVAPPVQIASAAAVSRGAGIAGLGTPSVVAPPAQVSGTGTDRRGIAGIGSPEAVAPPVQVGGSPSSREGLGGFATGADVVPPPATVAGSAMSGHGRGTHGGGSGGPLDIGDIAAPPKSGGGNGNGNGVVVSNQPGSAVGVPGKGGAGSLAMSPAGGAKPGLGGSGGGNGIGRGDGPGSGLAGSGTGAGKQGSGRGADLMAKGGISPYPGPGGAGSGSSGKPAVPGVSVRGGSNIVSLPSFDGGPADIMSPERSRTNMDRHGPGITVVATSRSGGAFNMYGALKGDKVYTIYIDTTLGTAVMQFADPRSAAHPTANDLTAPEPMRADLPAGLARSRLVIACVLDQSGVLKNARVLEPGPAEMTTKVLAALPNWKFRPVLRGDEPVEVNAILGFAIDTR